MEEDDLLCVIRWTSGLSVAPWSMACVVQEVLILARCLDAFFFHVKQSASMSADHLATEDL